MAVLEKETSGAQSIGRAVSLLRLVVEARGHGLGLTEIAQRAGLTKPTVRRILKALMENGLVEQDGESRRYFIGPETYVIGAMGSERFGIHKLSLASLSRLADQSGDVAFLSVRRGDHHVCLHREEGVFPIRTHVLHAGDRNPLGLGAAGLAILSALDEQEAADILERNQAVLKARCNAADLAIIPSLVADGRRRGFVINPGLVMQGSWGIGVPVRDSDGEVIGALSIAAIETRLQPDRQETLGPLLLAEARYLEGLLAEAKTTRTAKWVAQPSSAYRAHLSSGPSGKA